MLRIWFHIEIIAIGFGQEAQNLYKVLEDLAQGDSEKACTAMEAHVDVFTAQVKDKFIADRNHAVYPTLGSTVFSDTIRPASMTMRTRVRAEMSDKGSPSTISKSASLPTLIEPI
jgi:hypothetical protein